MKIEVLEIFETQGLEPALKTLRVQPQEDIVLILKAWDALARQIYNKQQDVSLMIELYHQALEYGLGIAKSSEDPLFTEEIHAEIKGLYYNLGANTWPGWGDEGITITPAQMAIGLQAAEANLKWAQKLNKPAIPTGRAYWLLAAHQLAAKNHSVAIENFRHAAQFAREGKAEGEALLADGFVLVVKLLQGAALTAELNAIKTALQALEHGDFFINQLEQSLQIFK